MLLETAEAVALLALALFAAKIGEEIFMRLGLPSFLGAIIAGMLLGRAGLNIITEEAYENTYIFYLIGLSFFLFLAGVEELAPHGKLVPRKRELFASIVMLITTTIAIALPAYFYMHMPLHAALAFGIAITIASLGPAIKLALYIKPMPIALLRLVVVLELLGIIAFNSLTEGFSINQLITTIIVVATIYFLGRRLFTKALIELERRTRAREAPFALLVSIIMGASFAAEYLGFNAAVTALVLGLFASDYLLKRPFFHERLQALTYGFLEPLFFVGIGITMVTPDIQSLLVAVIIFVIASGVKLLIGRLICREATIKGLAILLAKGGVDASLLYTGLSEHLFNPLHYTAGVTMLLLSTMVSALIVGARPGHVARERWRLRMLDLPLGYSVVSYTAPAIIAAEVAAAKGAVVVVDDNRRPLGYISAEDLVHASPELLEELKALDIMRVGVIAVHKNTPVLELAEDLAVEPIVAVVDDVGKVIGTITSKEFLAWLLGAKKEWKK